jgi:tetratricopeptide (TPR) repeat protein
MRLVLTLSMALPLLIGVSSAQQPKSSPQPPPAQAPAASTADDNPFPEDISRKAADAAKQPPPAPPEPVAGNPADATSPASNESSSNNGFVPPPDDDEKAPTNPERRKLSIYGDPRQCKSSTGELVPCGKLGMGGNVDENGDDPKARIAPGADHRALKDEEIADLYLKDGNYAGALGRYEEALSFAPDDEEAAFGVAECASKLGKRDEAIEAYKTYLKLAPQGKKANQARKAIQNLRSTAHH